MSSHMPMTRNWDDQMLKLKIATEYLETNISRASPSLIFAKSTHLVFFVSSNLQLGDGHLIFTSWDTLVYTNSEYREILVSYSYLEFQEKKKLQSSCLSENLIKGFLTHIYLYVCLFSSSFSLTKDEDQIRHKYMNTQCILLNS